MDPELVPWKRTALLLVVLAVVAWALGVTLGAEDSSPTYPEPVREVVEVRPEPIQADSITGNPIACIPTDLTDRCEPYTDTLIRETR